MRANKNVQNMVEQISDVTRQIGILEKDIQVKQSEINRMNRLGQDRFTHRENILMNLSMAILQLSEGGHGGLNTEEIFIEGDDPQITLRRRHISDLIVNLRFLYCHDPVSRLNPETRRVVLEHTQDWNVQCPIPEELNN